MKRLIGFLTMLTVFTLTSFGQHMINDVLFNLTVDGVPSTDFMVTYNPENHINPIGPGFLIVYFDNPMYSVNFQESDAIGVNYITEYYTEPQISVGIYMIKVDYNMLINGDINIVTTSLPDNIYLTTDFSALDTLNSWNDAMEIGIEWGLKEGISSVNNDSIFNAGVNSVICEWSESDTLTAFWNGYFSVDTMYYINMGALSVINTENVNKSIISGVDDNFVNMNLSVFPNPASQGEFININSYDYSHVDIYNINGQKIDTSVDTYISTSNLEKGFYVFHVWDINGNVNSTKIIVK